MLQLTTAQGLFFIQVQIKPKSHSVHDAFRNNFKLDNVVTATTFALALEKVLKHLAGLGEAGVRQRVQVTGFIPLVPPATSKTTLEW